MNKPTCVLLSTANESLARPAELFARECFDVRFESRHGWQNNRITDDLQTALEDGDIDYLFSFLSPVIIPRYMLEKVRKQCLNIHPAPPEYPGVGGPSRAIYDEGGTYGVTAHLMEEKVDTGKIIAVRRFGIFPHDTCETLDIRARMNALGLFQEMMERCLKEELRDCGEQWSGVCMSRKQFDDWMTLPLDASRDETLRKARALKHSHYPGPFIEFNGLKFAHQPNTCPQDRSKATSGLYWL